jgi:hemoglobin/transferrin/lactoferrin receptor protein
LDIARIIGERARIDVTGFYTILQDALVRRDALLNGRDSIIYNGELSQVQSIQNAASAYVYGIQASVELKLGGGFSILSKFNYQEGKEELDDGTNSPLRHAAPWFGVTRLKFITEGLDMQVYAMYSGEVSYENMSEEGRGTPYIFAIDENDNPFSPGWVTLNFKAAFPVSDDFTVSAGVENILDKRYRPYSSGLVAAGRNVILSLRAKF